MVMVPRGHYLRRLLLLLMPSLAWLVTAWGHLPTHVCGVVHGRLVMGGDATWLLKCAPEEVAMSALSRALLTVTRQRAYAS
jgi:hypothetical protein